MNTFKAVFLVGVALTVAGCSRTGGMQTASRAPVYNGPQINSSALPQVTQPTPTPSQEPIQQARLEAGNLDYIDSGVSSRLTAAQRSAATDAQFYALQFGRPGAPRNWSAGGASGQVSVGPYVRVNNRDCREFSHRVTIDGQSYSRSGTACRSTDGAWGVETA
jgi:surface antigen